MIESVEYSSLVCPFVVLKSKSLKWQRMSKNENWGTVILSEVSWRADDTWFMCLCLERSLWESFWTSYKANWLFCLCIYCTITHEFASNIHLINCLKIAAWIIKNPDVICFQYLQIIQMWIASYWDIVDRHLVYTALTVSLNSSHSFIDLVTFLCALGSRAIW